MITKLHLLNVNCQTTSDQHKEWEINEQTKQYKSKPKSSVKDNLYTNSKIT